MSLSLSLRLSLYCLLALPLSAGANPSLPRAGTIEIALAPGATSFLPIDTPELKEALCHGSVVDGKGPLSPRGECDLTIKVPSGMIILNADTAVSVDNGWQVPVHFGALGPWIGSATVDTACGSWDVSVSLDPDSEQPVSTLVLTESAETPGRGAFASVIDFAALYRFVNLTEGTHLEVPARLSLDLAGQWTTLPQGTPDPAETASASNIALYTLGVQEQQFSAPACGVWNNTRCFVCLTAEPPQR